MYRKKGSAYNFRTICGFRHPLGVLEVSPTNKGGLLHVHSYDMDETIGY